MKKDIKKDCRKLLVVSIVLSAMFVAGIPFIVLGATNLSSGGGYVFLMIVGIVFTAVGFYGTPICWVQYGEKVSLKNLYEIITVDKMYNVKELSQNLNKNEKTIANQITTLIQKRYLVGFTFVDRQELKVSDNVSKNTKIVNTKKCPNCGANLTISGNTGVCEYCNATFEIK